MDTINGRKDELKNEQRMHSHRRRCRPTSFSTSTSTSFQKKKTQPIVHYGFIPTILVLGMLYTEPRPSLVQLLSPM